MCQPYILFYSGAWLLLKVFIIQKHLKVILKLIKENKIRFKKLLNNHSCLVNIEQIKQNLTLLLAHPKFIVSVGITIQLIL